MDEKGVFDVNAQVVDEGVQTNFIEHWKGILENKNIVYRGFSQNNTELVFTFKNLKNATSYDIYIVESSENPDKWQANWGQVKKVR